MSERGYLIFIEIRVQLSIRKSFYASVIYFVSGHELETLVVIETISCYAALAFNAFAKNRVPIAKR